MPSICNAALTFTSAAGAAREGDAPSWMVESGVPAAAGVKAADPEGVRCTAAGVRCTGEAVASPLCFLINAAAFSLSASFSVG